MPLSLKSLELHGYKTFAAKFNFEFAEGITAIVGPNGSGKSNIADALRWVLGEQSYSLLRAKRTEDMIFAGSENRPRSGMASATVIFDNEKKWLPVDFTEVGLSRRAYRDGRNEYLLNGQHVRLKDINELLAQSGLSERTYTILGQGLVDASLALKADERRKLFEEAAGIGLYRSRREETLRRLETTRRNLDRVLDILAELEPRLRSLEKQASRAQEYAQIQSDLRVLLLEWYGYHWHLAQKNLTVTKDLVKKQELRVEEERESYQAIRQNYSAFHDQLNGLRGRLNSWHRQSAQIHASRESISSEIAALEERHRFWMAEKRSIETTQLDLDEEIFVAEEKKAESRAELIQLEEGIVDGQTQLAKAQQELDASQQAESRLKNDLIEVEQKEKILADQEIGLHAHLNELKVRNENNSQKLEKIHVGIREAEKDVEVADKEFLKLSSVRLKAEGNASKAQADLDTVKKRSSDLDELIKQKQFLVGEVQAEGARLKAQLEVLDQAEHTLAGFAEGAKMLLDAARQFQLTSSGGSLSASLDVPAELEIAIAAALGEYVDAVLVQSDTDAVQALSLLEEKGVGRASILPMSRLRPKKALPTPQGNDILGVAADLIGVPVELRPAVDLLLGQVIIVRDRSVAREGLTGNPNATQAVTLKGEVFHSTGQVVGGKTTTVPAISRTRRRRELQEFLSKNDHQSASLKSELLRLASQHETALTQLKDYEQVLVFALQELESTRKDEQEAKLKQETVKRNSKWQSEQRELIESEIVKTEAELDENTEALARIKDALTEIRTERDNLIITLDSIDLSDIHKQTTFWSSQLAVLEQSVSNARRQYSEREEVVNDLLRRKEEINSRLYEIDISLAEGEKTRLALHQKALEFNNKLVELDQLITPAEEELTSIEGKETELQRLEENGQAGLARVERIYNQLQLDLGRKQENLEVLRTKIEDDFGLVMFDYASEVSGPVPLPLDGMVEKLPVVTDLDPSLEEHLSRQRAQLRRMGPVNPEAQQEFQSVQERHAFLTAQMTDLHKAEADLHKVITELDELTHHEFKKTFDAVADQFHSIFHRLFGGGAARLVLTDPDDLTETGIDIEARLPGRREQGLSLLSGGERSLTAIALVFALLKVSPTPVCVMDEVDAMLDEANVGRFRDLLAELSRDTQFIIITHNRNTVQAADVIYGVTMGRDSTSQVISLRLDEVSEEYLK